MYVAREQVLKINWGSTRYVGLVTFNRLEYGIRTQSNKTAKYIFD
jgi:hypothetical protein